MFTFASVGLSGYSVKQKLGWTRNLRPTRVKETAIQSLAKSPWFKLNNVFSTCKACYNVRVWFNHVTWLLVNRKWWYWNSLPYCNSTLRDLEPKAKEINIASTEHIKRNSDDSDEDLDKLLKESYDLLDQHFRRREKKKCTFEIRIDSTTGRRETKHHLGHVLCVSDIPSGILTSIRETLTD